MAEPALLTALPEASLDDHVAILGTTGAGKTYAAKGEVEGLLRRGRRVCIVDPKSAWWGLRLQADGVTPSPFELVIFGGRRPDGTLGRADVEIDGGSGTRLAQLVAAGEFSGIVDTKTFTVRDRTRLLADFYEALNAALESPLHLVIDEAHLSAPKGRVNDFDSARMLGAAKELLSGARGLGARVMLLTQRQAELHNSALAMVKTLVAMLAVAPSDTAVVASWIKANADPREGARILASLPELHPGEGWIWAPRLRVLGRAKFRAISTYDNSATPDGAAPRADGVQLAPLDLPALRAALAGEAVAVAAAAAPQRRMQGVDLDQAALDEAHEAGEKRGYDRGYSKGFAAGAAKSGDMIAAACTGVLDDACSAMEAAIAKLRRSTSAPAQATPPEAKPAPVTAPRAKAPTPDMNGKRPARCKVLDAVAWWEAAGVYPIDRRRTCVFAKLSPKSSTFGVNVAELVREALLVSLPGGLLELTPAGRDAAAAPSSPRTIVALQDAARAVLTPAEAKVFDALMRVGGEDIRRDEIADELGLSRTASTLGVYLSSLTSLGFAETVGPGIVRAAPFLFSLKPKEAR